MLFPTILYETEKVMYIFKMASGKKKKILSKDELRRLMKQKQTTLKASTKIDHQFAKYNSLNQLVCTVCNTTLKSDLLWSAHIQSKSHKEVVAAKSLVGPAAPVTFKRPATDVDSFIVANKKAKGPNGTVAKSGLPADFFDKSSGKATPSKGLLADYGGSSSESDSEEESGPAKQAHPAASGAVPPGLTTDFFDKESKSEEVPEEKPKTMADKLPEGFFDDPKMDAKVRKVEYRDKMEDEWEQFQRAMKEESHVSEVIIEEDVEQTNLERKIEEIDDQINRWKEIEDLHDKKAEVVKKTCDGANNSDNDEDLDETELEELFDWRAKKTFK